MRIPQSTYRLQFNAGFTFSDAKKITDYLCELGISDIYASPVFRAKTKSAHGYDVVDPSQINPELGTFEEFKEVTLAVREKSMGWIQDFVPNHMSYSSENPYVMDLFENGRNSRYFDFFDINWDHPDTAMSGRVLAPFLGSFYDEALSNGEIKLNYGQNGYFVNYYEHVFPLKIETYIEVLSPGMAGLKNRLGRDDPDFVKLIGVVYVLKNLAGVDEAEERREQVVFIKKMLWDMYNNNGEIKKFMDNNLGAFNGQPGDPVSFNELDRLLSKQVYRISFWKVAAEEINYRRFFNINELISLNTRKKEVFDYIHSFIFELIKEKNVTGLRLDHIDGLYDPTFYLKAVRENVADTYVVVEKVLDSGEKIPYYWPVQGTTGYDSLNYINRALCDISAESRFKKIYDKFLGARVNYSEQLLGKKRLIIEKRMAGDVDNLARLLKNVSAGDRHGRDITLYALKRALVELLAVFPVYRSYIDGELLTEKDRNLIAEAAGSAKKLNPSLVHELNFLEKFLLLEYEEYMDEVIKKGVLHFVMKFQQLTGPLMAKGFEDTFLYIYNRLISLNEVGGSPDTFGVTDREFHLFNKERAEKWPGAMNATSTHDTKRGEDARARLNVLSEIPGEWDRRLRKWSRINRGGKKIKLDRNDEYFLYQAMLGSYPHTGKLPEDYTGRLKDYIIKATREAKVHTAWIKPDTDYEDSFVSFAQGLLKGGNNEFFDDFTEFKNRISFYGVFNSLSQVILKSTIPGVPDFYRGSELWDLSFVDPDNRRPVDFDMLRAKFSSVKKEISQKGEALTAQNLLNKSGTGDIKLFLINRLLTARRENRDLFLKSNYIPLKVTGKFKKNIIAFARKYEDRSLITAVPRLLTRVVSEGDLPIGEKIWKDTKIIIPKEIKGDFTEIICQKEYKGTEQEITAGSVFSSFPGAVMVSKNDS